MALPSISRRSLSGAALRTDVYCLDTLSSYSEMVDERCWRRFSKVLYSAKETATLRTVDIYSCLDRSLLFQVGRNDTRMGINRRYSIKEIRRFFPGEHAFSSCSITAINARRSQILAATFFGKEEDFCRWSISDLQHYAAAFHDRALFRALSRNTWNTLLRM